MLFALVGGLAALPNRWSAAITWSICRASAPTGRHQASTFANTAKPPPAGPAVAAGPAAAATAPVPLPLSSAPLLLFSTARSRGSTATTSATAAARTHAELEGVLARFWRLRHF